MKFSKKVTTGSKRLHNPLLLGGGAPRSAAENVNYNEAAKCTENAGSERECPGVTWRARSSLSARSTVGGRGASMELVERGETPGRTVMSQGSSGARRRMWIPVDDR